MSLECQPNGIPDECDPDCQPNGTPDACDILSGAREDCNSNAIPDDCELPPGGAGPDCDANGTLDECEIAGGTSLDCNGNATPDVCDIDVGFSLDDNSDGIPDECDRIPTVSAAGSRYIAIAPPVSAAAIALRITSPDWPCLNQYVQLDVGVGRLANTPMFLTWDAWGIVYVGDLAIRPQTIYEIQVDTGMPGSPDLSPPSEATTWAWGDVDGVGGASLQDLLIVLNQLSGDSEGIPIFQADLAGCIPDAAILLSDLLALLDALGGRHSPARHLVHKTVTNLPRALVRPSPMNNRCRIESHPRNR